MAPEGATNNLSGEMAPLEPGVAQLAFWAAEDLGKANDERPLVVLPIGIHYSWRHPNWIALEARLASLERHLGISSPDTGPDYSCLLYTSPSPRDRTRSRMPSSA